MTLREPLKPAGENSCSSGHILIAFTAPTCPVCHVLLLMDRLRKENIRLENQAGASNRYANDLSGKYAVLAKKVHELYPEILI